MTDMDTGSKGEIDCVVVERDWPMYEQVWQLIEDWVNEQQSQAS